MEKSIQQMIDAQAIRDVVVRYARGVDRLDWDLIRSCYHPDAIDEHGPYNGDVDGFIEWLQKRLLDFESSTHVIVNQLVELRGDDLAWCESYSLGIHRFAATDDVPESDWLVNCRYVDRMERGDGTWRIAHRVVVWEPGRRDPLVLPDEILGLPGRRDTDDPSYRLPEAVA